MARNNVPTRRLLYRGKAEGRLLAAHHSKRIEKIGAEGSHNFTTDNQLDALTDNRAKSGLKITHGTLAALRAAKEKKTCQKNTATKNDAIQHFQSPSHLASGQAKTDHHGRLGSQVTPP
ncbi:MAG: hypothetical protein GXP28_11245 [Planctomycetes bacterium]|nr:hypothetical protein [Planctomycetota bacterium]